MLSEIFISKNRKIGKVLSEKIFYSIFNGIIPPTQIKIKKTE